MRGRSNSKVGKASGVALIAVLLLLLLLSAAAIALMYSVNTEQHLQGTDQANGMAYYGAEAGMEKMMADLSDLYTKNSAPSPSQISAVACPSISGCSNFPTPADLNGTVISEYKINVPLNNAGDPAYTVSTISSGAEQGLQAQKLTLSLAVTAGRLEGGSNPLEQVRLLRNVEIALIPIFQFGVFCDSDCSYFDGPPFAFGGRVHTNKNLFLASGSNLIFKGPVHAVYDVVRDTLANGLGAAASGHTGQVYIPTGQGGCNGFDGTTAPPSTCRSLSYSNPDEGSSIGGSIQHTINGVLDPKRPSDGGTPNTTWITGVSGKYNTINLLGGFPPNGNAPPALTLPFVKPGVSNIEIIRRPQPADTTLLADSRLYNKAQIRVLMSDTAADLPAGARPLYNSPGNPSANKFAGPDPTDTDQTQIGFNPTDGSPTSLIGGYISVEIRSAAGTYSSVTDQWLALGIARDQQIPDSEHGRQNSYTKANPIGAILLVEQTNDVNTKNNQLGVAPSDFIPINVYETREGNLRDISDNSCHVGGVLNLTDIDVGNLQAWLAANPAVENKSENGYVLYFSDRRGTIPNPKTLVNVGEYGFTDVVNEAASDGAPNGLLDEGELADPGQPTKPETYGQNALGQGFGLPGTSPFTVLNFSKNKSKPDFAGGCRVGRKNWISGARHAVRLINGTLGNLPQRPNSDPNNQGGFTLTSENPAYVMGNYNASDAGFGNPHASAAVIADAVTLLSQQWSDVTSFTSPTGGRTAKTSFYRVAVAAGKNQNFTWANVAKLPNGNAVSTDFGTDGGMHNFLRYLESWGGQTLNYEGSLVSLYYSQYATGVFKCCISVYTPPNRNYDFDSDFQNLSEMPPGTPRFQAVINTGFRQDFSIR